MSFPSPVEIEHLLRAGAKAIPVGNGVYELRTSDKPSIQVSGKCYAAGKERIRRDAEVLWSEKGYEIANTGGPCWAAFKDVGSVRFQVADYEESRLPSPFGALTVEAFEASTGEYLGLVAEEVVGLVAVEASLTAWANEQGTTV